MGIKNSDMERIIKCWLAIYSKAEKTCRTGDRKGE